MNNYAVVVTFLNQKPTRWMYGKTTEVAMLTNLHEDLLHKFAMGLHLVELKVERY